MFDLENVCIISNNSAIYAQYIQLKKNVLAVEKKLKAQEDKVVQEIIKVNNIEISKYLNSGNKISKFSQPNVKKFLVRVRNGKSKIFTLAFEDAYSASYRKLDFEEILTLFCTK